MTKEVKRLRDEKVQRRVCKNKRGSCPNRKIEEKGLSGDTKP